MLDWTLVYEDFDPKCEGLREVLCTLGNGYFATRGAGEEVTADETHYPGTYLASGYNRLATELAGRVVENEDLVNLPNWLSLTFRPENGDWLDLRAVEILSYQQALHLKHGVLSRRLRFRDRQGRETTLLSRRFVHMADPHLAAIETTLTPENWSGRMLLRSALDGRVVNAGVARYRQLNGSHLEPMRSGGVDEDGIYLLVQTNQSHIQVAEAARTQVLCNGQEISVRRRHLEERGFIAQELEFDQTGGEPIVIEKIVALYTSRDHAISESSLEAGKAGCDAPAALKTCCRRIASLGSASGPSATSC